MTDENNAELLDTAAHAVLRSREASGRVGRRGLDQIVEVALAVRTALASGRKVLIFGNGGSASDAQHIAAEFVGRYVRERPGLPAIALNTDTSALTAIGNDYGYEAVFSRQVEALAQAGDVVIGLSTSGNSPNVVRALDRANDIGCTTVAFTSTRPSKSQEIADLSVESPSAETARIQECHILFGHILCELIDTEPGSASLHSLEPTISIGFDEHLTARLERWRAEKLRVVLTNGVFDLLHAGHLMSLEAAREHADVLVVAINSDESTRRLKGANRPVVSAADRALLLAGLSCTDHIVVFDGDDPSEIVSKLQPDVWCKGGDYSERDRSSIPEIAIVESYGGEVAFLPMLEDRSTTDVIARLRSSET